MATDHWYQYVPAVTAHVPCQGERHRLTWRWGKLKVEDHDLAGERAMLVLGGEPCPCLQALRFWGEQFGLRPELLSQMRRRMGDQALLVPQELDVPRDAGMALSLERAWKKGRYLDMQGRLIEQHVRDRALPALKAHLAAAKERFGARVVRSAQVRHVRAGSPVAIEGRMDSVSASATVTLSSDWVVDVWARGVAVVDGALVVEVTGPEREGLGTEDEPAATVPVRAVRWQPMHRQPNVAEPVIVAAFAVRTADGWRLNAEGADH